MNNNNLMNKESRIEFNNEKVNFNEQIIMKELGQNTNTELFSSKNNKVDSSISIAHGGNEPWQYKNHGDAAFSASGASQITGAQPAIFHHIFTILKNQYFLKL